MLNSDQKYETSINSGKQGKGEKIISLHIVANFR